MGQQQILLLILVTIIVGIMTVVAVNVFESSRNEGLKDIIRQDLISAAKYGQTYYHKPIVLGGGGKSFNNITLSILGLDTLTVLSRYSITETSQEYFKIIAEPLIGLDDFTIVVYSETVEWE